MESEERLEYITKTHVPNCDFLDTFSDNFTYFTYVLTKKHPEMMKKIEE